MRTYAHARKPASCLQRAPLSAASKGHVATPVRVREILHGPRLQSKLTVGPPDDAYEREADRVADAVIRMPEPEGRVQLVCPECEEEMQRSPLATSPSSDRIQRLCPECEEEMKRQPAPEEEEEDKTLQAKAAPGRVPEVTPDLESCIAALRGSGQPLASSERAFFEPRFGRGFDEVCIQSGPEAADLAQRVEARAFTLGHSVVFGQGEYRPDTSAGRRLLAHELTHVVQQENKGEVRRIQRTDWGPLGGQCCNNSGGQEWTLVENGDWFSLASGCTSASTDCDGMTCGGAFYWVGNLAGATCRTPRRDDATYAARRWTPTFPSRADALAPTQRGSRQSDVPPEYQYDER